MSILETATSGLIVAVGSAALTWVIGGAIARKYAISQKIKESDIALSKEFYQLYGEYFQLWKRWNATLKLKHDEHGSSEFEDKRWAVFARACEVEGRFEAVIVKLCAERNLTTEQVATLGCFRQSYQQLREQINSNEPLNWYWSSHEEYMVFKRGALSVGQIVFGGKHLSDLSSLSAIRSLSSLSAITSNEWEKQWIGPSQKAYKLAKQLLSRPDSEKVEAVTQK